MSWQGRTKKSDLESIASIINRQTRRNNLDLDWNRKRR